MMPQYNGKSGLVTGFQTDSGEVQEHEANSDRAGGWLVQLDDEVKSVMAFRSENLKLNPENDVGWAPSAPPMAPSAHLGYGTYR